MDEGFLGDDMINVKKSRAATRGFASAVSVAVLILMGATASRAADEATVKLFESKCASCHAKDGTGATVMGKALKVKDFKEPDVQKMSDDDLATLIAKGKDKMPGVEKTATPQQIKALVGYTRELAKK